MTRVLLFGLFGCGNSGNDASLAAVLDMLRRRAPEADVTCITVAPEVVAERFGIRALPIGTRAFDGGPWQRLDRMLGGLPRRLGTLLRAAALARRADVLLFPGTGTLDDFGSGPFGMPLAVFGWCAAARLAGTRVAFVSVGAGPADNPTSRRLFAWAARLAQYRSCRDNPSRDFLAAAGVDVRRDAVFPDLVFALPVPPVIPRRPEEPLRVGVGIMGYYGWSHDRDGGAGIHRAYLGKMEEFVTWLLASGHAVRLLTGDAGDDHAVAALEAAARAALPGPAAERLRAAPTADLAALMQEMASLDVVVGSRFHNMVAALKLGRPALSISYARKNDVLLEAAGLGRFRQHIEALDVDLLKAQFAELLTEREAREAEIRETVDFFQRRLREQEQMLAAWLPPANPASAPALRRPI